MATATEFILRPEQIRGLIADQCHGDPPWFTESDDVRLYRNSEGRYELYVNGEDTGVCSDPGAYDSIVGIIAN